MIDVSLLLAFYHRATTRQRISAAYHLGGLGPAIRTAISALAYKVEPDDPIQARFFSLAMLLIMILVGGVFVYIFFM